MSLTGKRRRCSWAAEIDALLGQLPLDFLHTFEAWQPAFGTGLSLTALAKRHRGLPVLANGSLHDPARAAEILSAREADMITLGRGALTHADWPGRVAEGARSANSTAVDLNRLLISRTLIKFGAVTSSRSQYSELEGVTALGHSAP